MMQEHYEALLTVADEVSPQLKFALGIAHETGHRIGAVRLLRWSDIDLEKGTVRWRAENDKIGYEHTVFLSEPAKRMLSQAKRACPAIGDAWLFPSPADASKPCSRFLMTEYWGRAAKLANLPTAERLG